MNEIPFVATFKTDASMLQSFDVAPFEFALFFVVVVCNHKQAIAFVYRDLYRLSLNFWTLPAQTMIKLCQIASFNGKMHTLSANPHSHYRWQNTYYSYFILQI